MTITRDEAAELQKDIAELRKEIEEVTGNRFLPYAVSVNAGVLGSLLTAAERAIALESGEVGAFDLVAHLERQRSFSMRTFGPGARTKGVIEHIRKELSEIEAAPNDIEEWIDVIILAFDGAWRAGFDPADTVAAMVAKQTKNEARKWPDWRTMREDQAIEHDRSDDHVQR